MRSRSSLSTLSPPSPFLGGLGWVVGRLPLMGGGRPRTTTHERAQFSTFPSSPQSVTYLGGFGRGYSTFFCSSSSFSPPLRSACTQTHSPPFFFSSSAFPHTQLSISLPLFLRRGELHLHVEVVGPLLGLGYPKGSLGAPGGDSGVGRQ